MAAPHIKDINTILPTVPDVAKILNAKLHYEAAQKTPDKTAWNNSHFKETPWGIAFLCSKAKHERSLASAKSKGWDKHGGYEAPAPKNDLALKCFIIAVVLDWQELVDQLKRTLKNWGYTSEDMQEIFETVWIPNLDSITKTVSECVKATKEVEEQLETTIVNKLIEAVEKHDTLNSKLFTKEEVLKEKVREKFLEIVDEFLADLKEQDIQINVDDILLIGSNASYNYTKDSDIDLHVLANTKKTKYDPEIAAAIYGAYRTLFNKQLDIKLYDIPVEIFVETEDSPRVSNGVYSVKKDKWIKKPVHEDIPDYDKDALKALVDKWEPKCLKLLDEVKEDKLEDEKKVVKLLEDIYEKLRKKGVAKGEYSIENLAFKELRNNGYLDKLKEARNELISKRLSLEERLDAKSRRDAYTQIARAAGSPPVIQDNGMFFIYNLKESEIDTRLRAVKNLPIVAEAFAQDSGKYDFSDVLRIATQQIPAKYYNIRGRLLDNI